MTLNPHDVAVIALIVPKPVIVVQMRDDREPFGSARTMREQYQRVASGVSEPTVSGHAGRVPPASRPALK